MSIQQTIESYLTRILANNSPNSTSDQRSHSAGEYDEDYGSSSKSGSTADSKNDGNSRRI